MPALAQMRRHLGVTQAEFAAAMGVPFRTLQDIETGKSKPRLIHLRAAEFATMKIAAETNQADKLSDDLKALVLGLADKLR
ncbi:helix-turn-helix transcriptional regulator [Agrobacterium rhizogenes]|nr:helix-turn-helix transcriptional regulator [Rhizobium rhizogenes]